MRLQFLRLNTTLAEKVLLTMGFAGYEILL